VSLDKELWKFSYVYPAQKRTHCEGSDYEWELTNKKDQVLYDEEGNKSYSYVFWEADTVNSEANQYFSSLLQRSKYFCFAKEEVLEKLDLLLTKLGLNISERNDMITYWIQKLTSKKNVLVSFLDETIYNKLARLEVIPAPKQILRTFMLFKPTDEEFESNSDLNSFSAREREHNVVVEWGAMHIY